ncbi:MAG: EFR1 family ferrodoxin [Desulfosudaceae bacterium]
MTETEQQFTALIVYLSLHGTTQQAVEVLTAGLVEAGVAAEAWNLSGRKEAGGWKKVFERIPAASLVVLASPTYFHHAPPVFTEFVAAMPAAAGDQAAAILSTFGGVSSGVIQYDLARLLHRKEYRLLGGLQVLTEHCLTFQEDRPFHRGHPDRQDLDKIRAFGRDLARRLINSEPNGYLPQAFKDKSFWMNWIDRYVNRLNNFTWVMPKVKVDTEACTGCGQCVSWCPTGNITLDPLAVHGNNCTYCYGCVRHCPAGAATAALKPAAPVVRGLARTFALTEPQVTRQVV